MRDDEVSGDSWGGKFFHGADLFSDTPTYLITQRLAGRGVKIIIVSISIRSLHESVGSNDVLMGFASLALNRCRTAEAEIIDNLKSKVAIHAGIVIHVIIDFVLAHRRYAGALDFGRLFFDLHFLISNIIRFFVICNWFSSILFDWTAGFYF